MKEMKRYEFRGEQLTAGEIAEKTGITQSIISSRLHAGKRGEELAEQPVSRGEAGRRALARIREEKQAGKNQEEGMSHAEIAETIGVSRKLVYTIEKKAMAKAERIMLRIGITKEDLL